jgi:hypothetical protein
VQDPPASDRESFFKPLFLTEAVRPPKEPRKVCKLIFMLHHRKHIRSKLEHNMKK